MKTYLMCLLGTLLFSSGELLAHGDVELGPSGGRLVELSKDETMHGEVSLKGDKFQIAILDKNLKQVKLSDQLLVANGGASGKPEKLAVEMSGDFFIVPVVKAGDWLILQYKENAKAKTVVARMQYDTSNCEKCNAQEWICKCAANAAAKDKK